MGRVAAIERFGRRLESVAHQYAEARKLGITDHQRRAVAHESLMAVIEFIETQEGWTGRDCGLVLLLEKLTEVELGSNPSMFVGTEGRPPVSDRVLQLRARYAAVMKFMIERGGKKREAAARWVWGKMPSSVQMTVGGGSRGTWRSVAGWRDEWERGEEMLGRLDLDDADPRVVMLRTFKTMDASLGSGIGAEKISNAVLVALAKQAP